MILAYSGIIIQAQTEARRGRFVKSTQASTTTKKKFKTLRVRDGKVKQREQTRVLYLSTEVGIIAGTFLNLLLLIRCRKMLLEEILKKEIFKFR